MVTLPVASSLTGVLAAFRVNVTMTPAGIVIVVKLKMPESGSGTVTVFPLTVLPGGTVVGGLKAPSAPVLPLLKVCASAEPALSAMVITTANVNRQFFFILHLIMHLLGDAISHITR
ncbi:MAG: hypothetical protein HY248_05665 [Fimbriimonas ginsengisoli]|nr:hypothetical protein [Fimbriimonas ginsengisoli]